MLTRVLGICILDRSTGNAQSNAGHGDAKAARPSFAAALSKLCCTCAGHLLTLRSAGATSDAACMQSFRPKAALVTLNAADKPGRRCTAAHLRPASAMWSRQQDIPPPPAAAPPVPRAALSAALCCRYEERRNALPARSCPVVVPESCQAAYDTLIGGFQGSDPCRPCINATLKTKLQDMGHD